MFWTCMGCGAPNSAAADVCGPCGRAFATGLDDMRGISRHRDGSGDSARLLALTGRSRTLLGVLREIFLLNVLFVLWRVVGHYALVGQAGAQRRGLDIARWERTLRLPSERALQRQVLPHHALVRVADAAYAYVHAPALGLVLVWLLIRHRDAYPRWRNVTVLFTASALLIQLIPVAPPRLIPSLGIVDTARADGLSVYGGPGRGLADQLASMPSIHVGWALIVAGAVVGSARGRWRWAAVAYPVAITLDVVVTGNHYWADAGAAALLLAVVVAAQRWSLQHRQGVDHQSRDSSDEGAVDPDELQVRAHL